MGVVTPHRAQMGKIIARLQDASPTTTPALLWGAVDTVERFQGQQRDVIVASFGLGDPDLIQAEDEFLYSLNRFNVMASRARAKLDRAHDALARGPPRRRRRRAARRRGLLKHFAEGFCRDPQPLTLGYFERGAFVAREGVLRTRR